MLGEHLRPATVLTSWPNRQAPETKELLYLGLENFVNLGDSEEEFARLRDKHPNFWPFDTQDSRLQWQSAARPALLAFRDLLRKIWTSDSESSDFYLMVLLGLDTEFDDHPLGEVCSDEYRRLGEAWAQFRMIHPNARIMKRPLVAPVWGRATFTYGPVTDFQRAVYALFLENWRAKKCPRCSRYFVASKSAQTYCSTKCSGGVKRDRALGWWRRKGAPRRKAASDVSKARSKVSRSSRVAKSMKSPSEGNKR